MLNNTIKNQRGLTLMELIISLAIISSVVVGALALYGSTNVSQKSTQIISDVQAIRASVRQLYGGQGTYGTANLNQVLVNAGRIPSTIRVTDSPLTLTHGLNGTVNVSGRGTQFSISVSGIDSAACVNLVLGNAGWDAIQVTTSEPANTTTGALTLPVTPDQASSSCSANSTNYVTFTSN